MFHNLLSFLSINMQISPQLHSKLSTELKYYLKGIAHVDLWEHALYYSEFIISTKELI